MPHHNYIRQQDIVGPCDQQVQQFKLQEKEQTTNIHVIKARWKEGKFEEAIKRWGIDSSFYFFFFLNCRGDQSLGNTLEGIMRKNHINAYKDKG